MGIIDDIVSDALGNVFTFARTMLLERELVPPYAWALGVAGVRVPVAIDRKRPDRVTIDWPRPAEAVAAG